MAVLWSRSSALFCAGVGVDLKTFSQVGCYASDVVPFTLMTVTFYFFILFAGRDCCVYAKVRL